MHRSGTSLVASVVERAGVHLGGGFARGIGQPRGQFEDHDFYDLHEAILAASGHSCFTAGDEVGREVAPPFEERARALVAARAHRPLWGWKDPRTALFLDLWDRVLPDARFVFLYRHPVDVALSLWRRNIDLEVRRDPSLAFRAWSVYNRRLLEFQARHPQRCFTAQAPALVTDLPGLVRRIATRFDLPLHVADFGDLYLQDELAAACQPPLSGWAELIPEALALYESLELVSDLPGAGEAAATGRRRRLLQASESLLQELLLARRDGAVPHEVGLRREFVRLRVQEEALQERLDAALEESEASRSHLAALTAESAALRSRLAAAERQVEVLHAIESSRSFAPIRSWWRLRRRWSRRPIERQRETTTG
jgi:hypothetical protein